MGSVATVKASPADIASAAQAVFEFRRKHVHDPEPAYRHPMMYATYKWDDLPTSEKVYYCDQVTIALVSFGISVPVAPAFEATHA